MQKNVAGQKWYVFAFDLTDNTPKAGDAAQITANLYIDGVLNAVDDVNPTELEDGYYAFDLSQAETNGDYILICPASSTANIQVVGVPGAVFTTPPNFPATSIDATGRLDVGKWLGQAVTLSTGNKPDVNVDEISDDAQTAIDAEDFFDTGYDPAAHKVQGVVLADTATAVTDDVGITQAGADKAWGAAARILTAATNITSDGAAIDQALIANLDVAVSTRAPEAAGNVAAIKAKTDLLPSGLPRGVALTNFTFLMTDSVNHQPSVGLAVTAQISQDGGALAGCTNAVAEIGNGLYSITLTAAEMTADVVTLRFTAAATDDRIVVLVTST
jgi:hypothetical protein